MRQVQPPTEQEIRDRCRQVQRTWDSRERWKRAGKPRRWTCPMVRLSELGAAMQDEYQERGGDE